MRALPILGSVLLLIATGLANESNDWAIQSQNPLADLLKCPLVNQFNQGAGYKDGTEYTLALNPSMPSKISDQWILINRLHIPFIYQPGLTSGQSDAHGLGDIQYESFYGPIGDRIFHWGIGPMIEIPSAFNNALGSRKWSAGLGGIGTVIKGPFVVGLRTNHLRSFAGGGNYPDIDLTTLEYFAYWNIGRGWSLGTSPINTANWEATSDEIWTVPVGGGIGKVIMNGRMPINFKLEAYHYIEQPATGAEWALLFEIQFLLPKDILFKN